MNVPPGIGLTSLKNKTPFYLPFAAIKNLGTSAGKAQITLKDDFNTSGLVRRVMNEVSYHPDNTLYVQETEQNIRDAATEAGLGLPPPEHG